LGLSQVVVMREPIHNQVAQAFLVRFLQSLAQYKDVHESLMDACQYLQLEKHLTYPSAYLIPSLFRHPNAPLFRLKPFGITQKLNCRLPTKTEAIALGTAVLLSLMAPVQHVLLNSRTLVQAIYRDTTNQQPQNTSPPVLLIAIDQESLNRADAEIEGFQTKPIDREYLAKLVTQLSALKVRTIGINYLLNTQEPRQEKLAQSVESAVNQQGTWVVFAASEPYNLRVTSKIASPNWSLEGDTTFSLWNVQLPTTSTCIQKSCSFAYLLALSQRLHQQSSLTGVPQPKLQSQTDFQQQVSHYLKQEKGQNNAISSLGRTAPFGLRSIVDWSIPPDRVYERIPSWKFLSLDLPNPELQQKLREQIVIVTSGGYVDAEDNFSVPWAINYWRNSHNSREQSKEDYPKVITGGEAQAYKVYRLLSQHQVALIPDLWMIILAAFLAKGTTLILLKQKPRQQQQCTAILVGTTAAYGIISLQIYISALVAIPWLLPSATFWIYVLLAIRQR
jgi:CHASE2 domain-containing sensor protein